MSEQQLSLEEAIRRYIATKTVENLVAVEEIITGQPKETCWTAIDAITSSNDAELKMALAETFVQTRSATSEEQAAWYNIDDKIMPIFGYLMDDYGTEQQMANLARAVVAYYQSAPDDQPAIVAVIKAVRDEAGFFGDPDNPDHEDGIYSQIVPADAEDDPDNQPNPDAPTT